MTNDKLIINLPDVEATLRLGSTLASFFSGNRKTDPHFYER
jgi:tRNA threonylcarbamoyladenosine biosynthesis protein TsaE